MASVKRHLKNALKALQKGDVNGAVENYNAILQKDGKNVEALVGLGRCLIMAQSGAPDPAQKAKLLQQGEELLDTALELDPNHAEGLVFRGVAYEAREDLVKAREFYVRGLEEDDSLFVGHFNLGRVAGQLKEWPLAVKHLEIATDTDSENFHGFYSLGIAYKESGNIQGSVEAFRTCVELDPTNLDAYMTLVDVLSMTRDLDAVWETLDRARTLFGDDPHILDRQLGLAIRQGRKEEAIDLADRLAENNDQAWLQVSTYSLNFSDYATAERAARSYLEVNPSSWKANYHLGLVYDEQGQTAEAEPYYRAAIEHGAEHWEAYNNLGTNMIGEEDPARIEEGVELLRKARALTGVDNPAPRYNLALGLYKLKQRDRAIEVCQEALQGAPPNHPLLPNIRRFFEAIQ